MNMVTSVRICGDNVCLEFLLTPSEPFSIGADALPTTDTNSALRAKTCGCSFSISAVLPLCEKAITYIKRTLSPWQMKYLKKAKTLPCHCRGEGRGRHGTIPHRGRSGKGN